MCIRLATIFLYLKWKKNKMLEYSILSIWSNSCHPLQCSRHLQTHEKGFSFASEFFDLCFFILRASATVKLLLSIQGTWLLHEHPGMPDKTWAIQLSSLQKQSCATIGDSTMLQSPVYTTENITKYTVAAWLQNDITTAEAHGLLRKTLQISKQVEWLHHQGARIE